MMVCNIMKRHKRPFHLARSFQFKKRPQIRVIGFNFSFFHQALCFFYTYKASRRRFSCFTKK